MFIRVKGKEMPPFKFIQVDIQRKIATIILNNTKKANSLNQVMWDEIRIVFLELQKNKDVRVCILKSNGKHFSSGIDINYLKAIMEKTKSQTPDHQTEFLYQTILKMQHAFSAITDCDKPVIAAIHGVCIGAGVDLITACDIRYSLYTSHFSIMETKLGIVADMGTLQRLPNIISDGALKELALTSKIFSAFKAKKIGLLNDCFLTRKRLYKKSYELAKQIASLPPHAVQGTKTTINYARDHTVAEGLEQIAQMNSVLLNSPTMNEELSKIDSILNR
jgi:enoyl-CoA hydratase